MYRFETLGWSDLTARDRAAWADFRAARPSLASPFFAPAFGDAVAAARGDARVVRVERAGAPAAFLPFHPGAFGRARPLGGPMSDWHGLIAPPGEAPPAQALLKAAGARVLSFHGAPADDPALAPFAAAASPSWTIDLSEGFDAWERDRRAAAPKAMRNLRARERRLTEAGIAAELVLDDRSPAALSRLLALKSAQYRRTRQFDVFAPRWTRALVERLHANPPRAEARGRLSTLWFDERLAAAHFGLEGGGVLHWWFTVYDEALAAYSPGLLLLLGVARRAESLGLRAIDLGAGDYRFKQDLADAAPDVLSGVLRARGAVSARPSVAAEEPRNAFAPLVRARRLTAKAARRADRTLAFLEARPAAARRPA